MGDVKTMKYPIDEENVSLAYLFSLFLKSQTKYFNDILKEYDITIKQLPILFRLYNHDFVYQKEISTDLHIDNGLLTRNLRKLEDNGYIDRIEDDENRRQNKIKLSSTGEKLTRYMFDEEKRRDTEIMENSWISRNELVKILIDLLEKSEKFNDNNINEE